MFNPRNVLLGRLSAKMNTSPERREKIIMSIIALTFVLIAAFEFTSEHKPQFLAVYLIPTFLTFFLHFNARKSKTIMIVGAISTVAAVADITLIHPNNFESFTSDMRLFIVAFIAFLQFAVCYFSVRQSRILASEQQKLVYLEKRQRYLRRLNSEIAENAPVAIAQLNAKLKYEMVNPHYLRLMRLQRGDDQLTLEGKSLKEFRALKPSESEWQAATAEIQKGQPVKFRDQLSVAKISGEISYYDWTIWPVQNEKGATESVLVLGADMTERIRGKRELEVALTALEKSNHAKDTFLATLSHELRTPLTPILGWARIMQDFPADDSLANKGLQAIERNARLQSQLVDDLLDLSRVTMGKVEIDYKPTELNEIVRRAIETVQYLAENKLLTVITELTPQPLLVNGDSRRLEQVFWNLLSNAVKFTPAGGQIKITTSIVKNCALIEVQDTGIGIAPEFRPLLFEPFKQADSTITRQHGGLGIGLAIAHSLVDMHNGKIEALSAGLGKGATFKVSIPIHKAKSPTPPATLTATQTKRFENTRVLILEDSADTRELLGVILEANGCQVCMTATVPEALEKLTSFQPMLIISDIGLPDEDGYAFAQQIRKLPSFQNLPMIALTGYAMEHDKKKAIASGFNQHLPKPVDPELLVNTIHSLLPQASA